MNEKLNIGSPDGLRESNSPNFIDMFYDNNKHYSDLLSEDCFLVVGRKGTGKTVLLKYFEKKNHSIDELRLVGYFEISEIKTDELLEFSFSDVNLEIRSHFQQYYLIKSSFLLVNKHSKSIKLKSFINKFGLIKGLRNYNKFKKILDEITELSFIPKMEEVIRQDYEFSIKDGSFFESEAKFGVGPFGGRVTGNESFENSVSQKPSNYYSNLEYYKNLLEELLQYITVILLFDDLEEAPINLKTNEISYIADFIENVYRYNLDLNKFDANSRAIVAVREDLMYKMYMTNSNLSRRTAGSSVSLHWVKDNKSVLEGMVYHKLRTSDKSLSKLSDDEIARKFFSINVKKDGSVKSIPGLSFLISKTMSRPRDVVIYLNKILADAEVSDGNLITRAIVRKYENSFSTALENELVSEMSAHFPSDALLNRTMLVMRDLGTRTKTGAELLKKFMESGFEKESAVISLQLLLKFSVIGRVTYLNKDETQREFSTRQKKSQKPLSFYQFQYYSTVQFVFSENDTYIVHEGLYQSFGIY